MEDVLKNSKFENVFGISLAAPQSVIFNSMLNLNYAVFRISRGGGKDLLLAMYAMLYAVWEPESRILITTPTHKQAKMTFNMLDVITSRAGNKYFQGVVFEPHISSDACFLQFKNGSRIDAGTEYDGSSDIVLVNESSSMPEPRLSKLLVDVENGNLKKVFLMSTGYYDYNCMNKIEAHECFSTHAFGYKAFPSGFYDQKNINEAKKILSVDVFNMDYNAKVVKVNQGERSEDENAT